MNSLKELLLKYGFPSCNHGTTSSVSGIMNLNGAFLGRELVDFSQFSKKSISPKYSTLLTEMSHMKKYLMC